MQLTLQFTDYNDMYFDNELPVPNFEFNSSYRTLGTYETYPTEEGHYGDVITISDKYDFTEEQFRDIMVHEMIHMYLMHFGIDKKCSHGKEFRNMMNDLNKRYNLHMGVTSNIKIYKLKEGKSKLMQTICTLF